MTMTKGISLGIFIGSVTLALSGCGGDGNTVQDTPVASTNIKSDAFSSEVKTVMDTGSDLSDPAVMDSPVSDSSDTSEPIPLT